MYYKNLKIRQRNAELFLKMVFQVMKQGCPDIDYFIQLLKRTSIFYQ
jgi:hypothetical protein